MRACSRCSPSSTASGFRSGAKCPAPPARSRRRATCANASIGFPSPTRPPQLVRIIEPVSGLPRITIRFRPTYNYGEPVLHHSIGSNHIRYTGENQVIRLTTDAPLSYIEREAPFVLTRPVHLAFGADEQ